MSFEGGVLMGAEGREKTYSKVCNKPMGAKTGAAAKLRFEENRKGLLEKRAKQKLAKEGGVKD